MPSTDLASEGIFAADPDSNRALRKLGKFGITTPFFAPFISILGKKR